MSTFTQADHDKAVELYERYKDAEWWPKDLQYGTYTVQVYKTQPHWHYNQTPALSSDHALSAIAWAMVERLGDVDLYHDPDKGYIEYGQGVIGSSRFLALAAAVEALDKGG